MKKHSTFVGMDLGKRTSSYQMLDGKGVATEDGVVQTVPDALRMKFGHLKRVIFAIEVCGVSRWVEEVLRSMGHDVVVANSRKLKAISANTRKSDKRDAMLLARLLRTDPSLLHPVHHRSRDAQIDLTLLRCREALVASRSTFISTMRALFGSFAIFVKKCDAVSFHKHARAMLTPELQPALKPLIDMIEQLTQRIREIDRQIEYVAQERYPEAGLLQSIPGVGPITSLAFVLTIGNPHRFAKSRDVAAYLGLVPKRDQSGGSDPQLRIAKDGDTYVRKLLVGCAFHILRSGQDSAMQAWTLKLKDRGGRAANKRAAVALARKLATVMHSMWVNGEFFNPWPNESKAVKVA